jgi:hypothetical protein
MHYVYNNAHQYKDLTCVCLESQQQLTTVTTVRTVYKVID